MLFIAVFLTGVLPALIIWVRAWDDWNVIITDPPHISESAAQSLIAVLREATSVVRIHDDGANTPASVYNHAGVVDEAMRRMADGVEIRCLFRQAECRRLTLVERAAAQHRDRFRWAVRDDPLDDSVLGKVADDGAMAHLSRQELNCRDRAGRRVDCLSAGTRTRRLTMGPYIQWFDDQFAQAVPAGHG